MKRITGKYNEGKAVIRYQLTVSDGIPLHVTDVCKKRINQ